MSTNEIATQGAQAGAPVAKDAPTEQQSSKAGVPKRFERGQTVCNEKNDKGKLHNGHLKQVSPVREEARRHMRGDDLLYRCQTCGTLYMGPPLGHVRDPRKQARYVQSELVDILEAAGGTLPAFKKTETGAWVPVSEATPHAPAQAATAQNDKAVAPATPAAKPASAAPAPAAAPATGGETPEQKRARIIAEAKAKAAARMAGGAPAQSDTQADAPPPAVSSAPAASAPSSAAPDGETAEERRARMMAEVKAKAAARMAAKNSSSGARGGGETAIDMPPTTAQPPSPTSGTDSSTSADAHRPAAEAQAATGQASAAPLSPAAATASPAAGAETPADLAPDASTELTPGAPADERADDEGPNG